MKIRMIINQKLIVGACTVAFLATSGGTALGKIPWKKVDAKKSGPSQEDAISYFSADEPKAPADKLKMADELRLKTISSIKTMLKKKISADSEFELYLRMGELHLERHDYLRSLEIDKFATEHDNWDKTQKGAEPKIDHTASREEMLQGATVFRKIATKYPHHMRADAALFELAKTLGRLDNDSAELYFQQLIKQHEKSPLIPSAYLALGEFYFYRHRIPEALNAYKSAVKYKDSDVYLYSIYKLGWSYYNAGAHSEKTEQENLSHALASFKLVIALCSKKETRKNIDLKHEALNDLVMVWADTRGVDDAWEYFSRLGEKESFYDLLERLGGIYAEQGQNDKAIITYTRLLQETPTRASNPETYVKLVDLHYQANHPEAVIQCLKNMAALYTVHSEWTEHNKTNTSLIAEARDRSQRNIHRYAALYHQRGQKYKSNELLSTAANLYRVYLLNFPQSEPSYEIRYLFADILMQFKKYEDAADEYSKVVNQKLKDGKYLKPAAFNAVLAMISLDEGQKYQALPAAGKVSKPIELPRIRQKLLSVIATYLKLFPDEVAGHSMRYTDAQTYFDYGFYDLALQKFTAIALSIPATKQGKSAVKVVIAYHGQQKDWDKLVASARVFIKTGKFEDKEIATLLIDNVKLGVYQKALVLEQEKKYLESAEMYLAFQKEFPQDKNSDHALYNASVNYYRISSVDAALSTSRKLLETYPDSALVPDVTLDTATAYEGLANFDSAAELYEKFFRRFSQDKRAPTALNNAAALYRGLKQYPKAIALSELFVKYYPKHEFTIGILYELADLKQKTHDYKGSVATLEYYGNRLSNKNDDDFLEAQARIADLTYRHVDEKAGLSMIKEMALTLSASKTQPAYEARRIIAEAAFKNIDNEFVAFKKTSLKDPKHLEHDVKTKQDHLLGLAQRYEKVIAIGSGEFIVASLYRLGEMHESFAEDLFNVNPPKGASQIQIDAFKSSIEKVAFPLHDEAYKYYEAAYKQAEDVNTFTEWTKLAYQKMTEIDPSKYAKVFERTTAPVYLEHVLKWDQNLAKSLMD